MRLRYFAYLCFTREKPEADKLSILLPKVTYLECGRARIQGQSAWSGACSLVYFASSVMYPCLRCSSSSHLLIFVLSFKHLKDILYISDTY